MLTKEKAIHTIKELPETFSIDELIERIIFIQKVEIGLKQSKSRKTKTTKEAKSKLKKWLKSDGQTTPKSNIPNPKCIFFLG